MIEKAAAAPRIAVIFDRGVGSDDFASRKIVETIGFFELVEAATRHTVESAFSTAGPIDAKP